MRVAIIHLLAMGGLGTRDVLSKLGSHAGAVRNYIPTCAENTGGRNPADERWELTNRAWKEIEPWKFNYKTQQDRQKAIDNAIRAFDRQRLPRDDPLWQVLLPREERGKGKVLSRLNLGVSPMYSAGDKPDNNISTPKVGPASTPRNGAVTTSRGNAGKSIIQLKKEAKKKEELEKKRQAKEAAAASDRESKAKDVTKTKSTTTTAARKMPVKEVAGRFKSAEVVHDSDSDDPREVRRTKPVKGSEKPLSDSRRTTVDSKTSPSKPTPDPKQPIKADVKAKTPSSQATKPPPRDISSARPTKRENAVASSTASSGLATASSKTATTAKAKSTASDRTTKTSQTASSSERASSPKNINKPKVPSPLGTSKPRTASEEPEKPRKVLPAKPVNTSPPSSSKKATAANGSAQKTPRPGLFGDNGRPSPVVKKRPLEQIDHGNEPPHKAIKVNGGLTAKASSAATSKSSTRPSQNGDGSKQTTIPSASSSDSKLKRKASDTVPDDQARAPKHRKTDSSSTHSLDAPTNSSLTSLTTGPSPSPAASPRSPLHQRTASSDDVIQRFLNDSSSSPKMRSDWESALDKAKRFRTQLYPAYLELYDRLEGMSPGDVDEEDRRTLFMMHGKLKALKKEIHDAVG